MFGLPSESPTCGAGELPKQLSEVKIVPVPNDPTTGVPFQYKVEGKKITLHSPAPAGREVLRHLSLTYVLNLQGK